VTDPTGRIIENLGGRERLVTALVGENPETGSEETLNDRIQYP